MPANAKKSLHIGIGNRKKSKPSLEQIDLTMNLNTLPTTKNLGIFVNSEFILALNKAKDINFFNKLLFSKLFPETFML